MRFFHFVLLFLLKSLPDDTFWPIFFVGMDNQPSETRHRRKKMGWKRGGGESDEAFCK